MTYRTHAATLSGTTNSRSLRYSASAAGSARARPRYQGSTPATRPRRKSVLASSSSVTGPVGSCAISESIATSAESGLPTSRSRRARARRTSGLRAAGVRAARRSAASATPSRKLTRCRRAVLLNSTRPRAKPGSTSALLAKSLADRVSASLPRALCNPRNSANSASPMPSSAKPRPSQPYGHWDCRSTVHWNSEAASS